ncbi:hypothetical protein FGIG_06086 [Fasciola gigantica]|uniref:Uncharacterized protein n=1 Tax=Fasciola gigantica TaxID=46835 RepID=A0A504YRG9_FASGI|nr:hypothetical protein FGIG_06086 [Fasciola gigantica]
MTRFSDSSDSTDQEQGTKYLAEWTLWNHGMRLSIANGQIGLARLQQFTRGPCSLHRCSWTNRCLGELSQTLGHRDGQLVNFDSDEWEELSATEGEELNPDCASHESEREIFAPSSSGSRNLSSMRTYRSGVVGAARSTYQNRRVHLLRWITRSNRGPRDGDHKSDFPEVESSQAKLQTTDTASRPASAFAFLQPGDMVLENYGMLIGIVI